MDQNQDSQFQQEIAPYTEFFSWGSDQFGQLALANTDEEENQYQQNVPFSEEPKSLSFDIIIKQISCGENHAAFISGDSFVFCVGKNNEGQLGVGDPSLAKSSAPLLVDALPKDENLWTVQVSCGGNHTAAVMSNGDVYSWGQGNYGATGISTTQNTFAPIKINFKQQEQFINIVSASCGKRHTMILDNNGVVFVTGDNSFRQLGIPHKDRVLEYHQIPDFNYKAKMIDAGIDHSMILTSDDKIYGAGNNKYGNLGLGHTYSSDSFLLVHGLQPTMKFKQIQAKRHSAALTEDGRLFVWGMVFRNDQPLLMPQELKSNKGIRQIAVGDKVSSIIDEDYHVYTWGLDNNLGQLGRRDTFEQDENNMPSIIESLQFKQVTQISIGGDFCIALGQDFDEYGQPIQRQSFIQEQPAFQYNEETQPTSYQNYRQEQTATKSQMNNGPYEYNRENQIQKESSFVIPQQQPQPRYNQPRDTDQKPNHREIFQSPPIINNDNSQISSGAGSQRKQQDTYNSNPSLNQRNKDQEKILVQSQGNDQRIHGSSDRNKSQAPIAGTYPAGSNVELYKQLDQLRQENFELKQKQRELITGLNALKIENEQVLNHADDEIKRMGEFVDKFTVQVENSKKLLEDEFDEKIQIERRKNDELKNRFHQEQTLLDQKLDKLQREIEMLKQENQSLQFEKKDQADKYKSTVEQLEQTQQKLKQAEQQIQQLQSVERDKNLSPLGTAKPQYFQEDNYHYGSRTPGGYSTNMRPPILNNDRQAQLLRRGEPTNDASYQQYPSLKNSQYDEQKSASRLNGNHPAGDGNYFNEKKQSYSPFQQKYDDYSDPRNEKQTPNRYGNTLNTMSIYSPMRSRDQPQQQINNLSNPSYNRDENQRFRMQQVEQQPLASHMASQQRYSSIQDVHQTSISPNLNTQPREEPNYLRSEAKYSNQGYQTSLSATNTAPLNAPLHEINDQQLDKEQAKQDTIPDRGTALNDVKNRLMVMQKNKEELEEKLRNYEAKIRQHFNRT
ncbi:UNKNOWN [Stylonychia lemnae]|uniref:RCC1-like domain-containing protein n=1 Tax=Stylonychia lemnae TaxID=5949 RepID=A0A078AA41_STYLE|nr:UNKNOWN [Stylonychia lemnae]|eukprot:CDW78422.1 UNKNOWN [Stylonychia lemnae]